VNFNKKYSYQETFNNFEKILGLWKKQIITGLFIFVFASVISSFIPYIYGSATDAVLVSEDYQKAFILIGLWLLISLSKTFLFYFAGQIRNKIQVESAVETSMKLYAHISTLPMSFHKDKKKGSVFRRIDQGIYRGLENFISRILFSFLPNIIKLITALIILLFIEWHLALILIFSSLIYIFTVSYYSKLLIKTQDIMQKAYEKTYGVVYDAISNIHNIKITGNEKYEEKRMRNSSKKIIFSEGKLLQLWESLHIKQSIISDIGFVSVFALGIFFLSQGRLTTGELIMFIGYSSLLLTPLSMLTEQFRTLKESGNYLNRAMKLLNISPENTKNGKDIPIIGDLEFKNISFSYPGSKNTTLKNINFKINAGEIVALVGKSGVGKTTLIDLIGNYYFPQKGVVEIDGVNSKKINLLSLRNQMAVVPQEVSLFNDTIFNNIQYSNPKASREEVIKASQAANADEFIQKFPKKYKQKVGERGIKLSTGQKQRIAIARAILRDPKILILDEATSALDSQSERLVQEALSRLVKGRTTFIIAHRLSTIQKADKIIVLEKGKIAEMGRHAELMKNENGIYRNFWELQSARKSV